MIDWCLSPFCVMIMSLILILILYCYYYYYYYYYKENVVFIVNKALLFFLAFVKCVIAEIQVYTLTLGLQKISLRCKIENVGWDGWWMLTIGTFCCESFVTRFILSHCNSRNGVRRVELNDNDIRGFQARFWSVSGNKDIKSTCYILSNITCQLVQF